MHFSFCKLQILQIFYWEGQKTFLPFLYGNPTSDLIIAMSHNHAVIIHLDFRTHFSFSGSELCIWFSVIWHQSMATVCMMRRFQGGPEEPLEGVMMTVGRLVSCRRVGERIQEMSLWLSAQNKYHTVGTPEKRLALYILLPSCLGFLYCLCSWKKIQKPPSCGAHTLLMVLWDNTDVQIHVITCDYKDFLFGHGCDV